MSSRTIRYIANGIITIFSILIVTARLISFSASRQYWLWGIPALFISLLDIFFLTKSMLLEPKNVDTGFMTFLISVSGSMGFGLSALVINYPAMNIPAAAVFRSVGSILALLPYPFIIWALFSLKDCLTVIPEAHKVVARGIYRYSRHPLYICFMIWALANILMFPSWPVLLVSCLHITILFLRLFREEQLLLATFPEYREYYQRTGLIGNIRLKI